MINPMIILFLLGVLQGLVGWIMVMSGLDDSELVYVSHYKLAIHFILAMVLICYTLWFALGMLVPKEKIIAEQSLSLEKEKVALASSKNNTLMLIAGLTIVGIAFLFLFYYNSKTKKLYSLIQTQKKEVELQKEIIEIKNKETEGQKKLIEEKQKDILDSIRYAKRIQESLLPTLKYIERTLNRLKN